MKSLLLLSAMLVAAPAMAQTATPPASTNAAQSAASAQQAPQPATDAPAASSSSTAPTGTATAPASGASTTTSGSGTATTSTTANTTTANPSDAVAAVVTNDWAKYDGDKNGDLSKTEFASWMTALREQNPAQKAQVKDVNAWTSAAFTQADKDKSGAVSKDELQGFLKG